MPPYSCQFNAIETLWARIKAKVFPFHTKCLFTREHERAHMVALVQMEYEENIDDVTFNNIFRASTPYINSFLNPINRI